MKLYIKNMVCIRCKMVVKDVLNKLGVEYTSIELGEVFITTPLTAELHEQLKHQLAEYGLELIECKKNVLLNKIKTIIVEMVQNLDNPLVINFSSYLSEKTGYDYTYLSNKFSEMCGITIRDYIIAHKVEKVKELILLNEQNLTEIAFTLDYSSVAHLSSQFKKVTGLTPTDFRQQKQKSRKMLQDV